MRPTEATASLQILQMTSEAEMKARLSAQKIKNKKTLLEFR